ncbi:MAG: heavy metal translocating P-type ATPase [Saccharofermentanales bacterium]
MSGFLNRHKNHITVASGILIAMGYALALLADYTDIGRDADLRLIRDIVLITATVIAVIPIATRAFQALLLKAFSIELLVTIAVAGALFIHEYTESSVVTFLFLFGAYLEARTLEKTRSSLKALLDLAPAEATVVRDGQTSTVPVEEVVKGDRVIIRTGGKVPVDGSIVSGKALINEAAITGESVPAAKEAGDKVFSGTILDSGYIEIVAEKVGDDTTFAKIIELVEEAQDSKSRTVRFLDRFANIYTPAIVVLSVIVYLIMRDLHIAITFLVVACPGALVIGAPVSYVAGIGNGARNGVLIKGGEVMDKLSKVNTLIFDKTGTLTKGRPEVTDIRIFGDFSENELLRLVAEAETISEHHLGRTIVKEALRRNIALAGEQFSGEVIKGSGVRADVEGHALLVGNRKLLADEQIGLSDESAGYAVLREKSGSTAIYAVVDGVLAGIFSVADQIRDDAHTALAEMRKNGIQKIIMLTGDNRHTAQAVADTLGLDEFYAELMPENKVEYVKKLRAEGRIVAMAGDGINDAPAIATADIGLAMGEGGTDVSMETADIVLMADKLMQLSHAYSLAKATIRNMKQNTFFAVAVVLLLLAGVLFEYVHLASGMFVHEGSILLVILNAMRLIRFKNRQRISTGRRQSPHNRSV